MITRLKELRKNKNMKQEEIGKIIGLTQRGYSHYENDRDIPSDVLISLAKFYDTSVDYILYFTDQVKPYDRNKYINSSNNVKNGINKLKDLREDKDLHQKDIGNVIGKARSSYSYYENGGDISTDVLIKLAIYYNTSIDYILGITDQDKPYPLGNEFKTK